MGETWWRDGTATSVKGALLIYVIRHGQTELNSAHALQGRSDQPLNAMGEKQARTVGRLLAERGITFSHAFSSPSQRAVQTARLVAPGAPLTCDDRLLEMDYGPYEGADLRNPAPEIITFFSDFVHNPAPAGMEQLSSVVERTGTFIEELAGTTENVLVSTHAIAMKGILEYLTPGSEGSFWARNLGNCAVWAIACHEGRLGVPVDVAL